ncbi:hypothetical protein [Bifidobacterium angulatum]|uniref:hypothetical protein n=1 Tax=Bifidobacterium angulatum TaxID=1683 RepID=UPI0005F9205F|nr:hypothetical protein [Bifidobacterium angulatum]AMK57345.1 hypothetical protein Bang102_001895 [Bifidobacterium angulatum]
MLFRIAGDWRIYIFYKYAKKNEQQLGGSQQTALKPTEQATLNAAKTFDAGTGNLASTGTETTALIFTPHHTCHPRPCCMGAVSPQGCKALARCLMLLMW